MALFNNIKLTNSGVEIIHQLVAAGGTPVVFSTIALGDGELPEGTEIASLESLVNERIRTNVETLEHDTQGRISLLSARISSSDLQDDLIHREIGVYVLYDGQETLFAYGNAGDNYDYIPAAGTNAAITKLILASFSFASLNTIYKDLPSDRFVTYAAFESRIQQILPGMVNDKVQAALAATGTVALKDKPNTFLTPGNNFAHPLGVPPAETPSQATPLNQSIGVSQFFAECEHQFGWPIGAPYRATGFTAGSNLVGTTLDRFIRLTLPAVKAGASTANKQLILRISEYDNGFYNYMLPRFFWVPVLDNDSFAVRMTIGRVMTPKATLPENNDDPCLTVSETPDAAIAGKFWVELTRLNNDFTVVNGRTTKRIRIRVNYCPQPTTTTPAVLKTFYADVPCETVYSKLYITGVGISRDTQNGKAYVYVTVRGSHQKSADKIHIYRVAEFDNWNEYTATHNLFASWFFDGGAREWERYGYELYIFPPKLYRDQSIIDYFYNNSTAVYTAAEQETEL